MKFIEHCLDLEELASVDVITETIKEFALLDREFVVRRDGTMLAAGRYMNINWDISLQDGLGGRQYSIYLKSTLKILTGKPVLSKRLHQTQARNEGSNREML